MKTNFTLYLIVLFFIFCTALTANAQQAIPNTNNKEAKKDTTEKEKTTVESATEKATASKQLIRTAANLKSGTSQDVLTSFFKLGFTDVNNTHRFQFSSSLFAIRAKTDTSVWLDKNYRNLKFSRNFVFGFDYGLDTNFKFKYASLNVKYAIINKRDEALFETGPGIALRKLHSKGNELVATAQQIYFAKNKNISAKEKSLIFNYYNYGKDSLKTKKELLPVKFVYILDSLQNSENFKIDSLRERIAILYNTASALLKQKSLWTIETKLYTDKKNTISKVNINTEYLKGLTKPQSKTDVEFDIKANFTAYDTTMVGNSIRRNIFSASAGINWIIYKNPETQKSYIEFKPALSYDNILSGKLATEKNNKFFGEGVLRFRVTDDIWLPINIKYDIETGNVLGFLNITSNFDWLGAKK